MCLNGNVDTNTAVLPIPSHPQKQFTQLVINTAKLHVHQNASASQKLNNELLSIDGEAVAARGLEK